MFYNASHEMNIIETIMLEFVTRIKHNIHKLNVQMNLVRKAREKLIDNQRILCQEMQLFGNAA